MAPRELRLLCGAASMSALLATWLACVPPAAAQGGCPFIYLAGSVGWTASNDDINKVGRTLWTEPTYSDPSSCTASQYREIAEGLIQLVEGMDKNMAYLLRIGFHACGTWSASGRNAGCNGGWLRFSEDAAHGSNAGLTELLTAMEEWRQSTYPCITFADLVTFGAAVGVEHAGGPPIAWYPGRRDALAAGPSTPPYSARLPSGAFEPAGVLNYYTNLGLTMREAVALTGGGHSIGGAEKNASGWDGAFVASGDRWPTPHNQYFVDLIRYGWKQEIIKGTSRKADRLQYVLIEGQGAQEATADGAKVIRLPSDIALRASRVFSEWAVTYALYEDAFRLDFQRAMQRVLQLGAGETWEIDRSYRWRGFGDCWEGFGSDIKPHSDVDNKPITWDQDVESIARMDQIAAELADPARPFPEEWRPVITRPAPGATLCGGVPSKIEVVGWSDGEGGTGTGSGSGSGSGSGATPMGSCVSSVATPLPNTDLYGGDHSEFPRFVASEEECCTACRQDDQCGAYTYNALTTWCWLKHASGWRPLPYPGAYSGVFAELSK